MTVSDGGTSTAYSSPDQSRLPHHFQSAVGTRATDVHRDAILGEDGLYRYMLSRVWAVGPVAAFVMLNPSTADGLVDDPTVKKCVGFAKSWGCGSIYIGNLFAYRTAYPKVLFEAAGRGVDIVGPYNDRFLDQAAVAASATGGLLVFAWGANAPHEHARAVGDRLATSRASTLCLGANKDGSPRHPLMLGYDTPLELWSADRLVS